MKNPYLIKGFQILELWHVELLDNYLASRAYYKQFLIENKPDWVNDFINEQTCRLSKNLLKEYIQYIQQ